MEGFPGIAQRKVKKKTNKNQQPSRIIKASNKMRDEDSMLLY